MEGPLLLSENSVLVGGEEKSAILEGAYTTLHLNSPDVYSLVCGTEKTAVWHPYAFLVLQYASRQEKTVICQYIQAQFTDSSLTNGYRQTVRKGKHT
jgi:uncharacterized Zn-finger protein